MSRIRKLIMSRSGARTGDLEAESRAWHIQCPVCGSSKSVWELGGVRYKAASRGKRIRGHCSTCGTRRWLRYVRIDPAVSSEIVAGPEAGAEGESPGDGHAGGGGVHGTTAQPGAEGDPHTDRTKGDDGPS